MVLLGHNGAGKTTLINYILGFYADISQHPFLPEFHAFLEKKEFSAARCAYVPESPALDTELNAKNYFTLFGAINGKSGYDPKALMERVMLDVPLNRPIKRYSKGMKQRLMLALALLADPETIILDEPTSGLDPYGKEMIEAMITELAQTHRLIVSTHSLDLAFRLKEEIWILQNGRVVFDGNVASLGELEVLMTRYRPEELL
jgi:ABC-2 type transport system ATP-binding protein